MLLEVSNITKSFGSKPVLHNASLKVQPGEIHGLVGKNGAGKSTLVNIISGVLTHYAGSVLKDGKSIDKLGVRERQQAGIYVVPQHVAVIPDLTVAENLFIGMWPKRGRTIDWKTLYDKAMDELANYGVKCDVREKVSRLPLVEQRKLNIVRAIFSNASLIILDEPTAALSVAERRNLFDFVRRLSGTGTSFIFISHYLEEILELCDTITVIRDGYSYTGYSRDEVNEETLSQLIVGDQVTLVHRVSTPAEVQGKKPVVMKLENVTGNGLKGVNFELHSGQVIGVVGFPGSGAREFCRAVCGAQFSEGHMEINGVQVRMPKSPKESIANSIVYVSYDRHAEGIIPMLSIRENINLSILSRIAKSVGVIQRNVAADNANKYFSHLSVKATSIEEEVGRLSGGNQQKVLIGRALSTKPKVLILDEPTIGIDVKSREEILGVVNRMTDEGVGVLYLTNDYNELLRICDQLAFFSGGKLVRKVVNDHLSVEDVIRLRDQVEEGKVS